MSDFFKLRVGPKPFLWLILFLGFCAAALMVNPLIYSAWMNAHPHADNPYWGFVFYVGASLFMVIALVWLWAVVRLVRIRRLEKHTQQEKPSA